MKSLLTALYITLFAFTSFSQNDITLRRSFIDSLSNTVSISGTFIIDHAHKKANKPDKDGDLHIAGRNKQVGLPTVAEIMNAVKYPDAISLIHSEEGKSTGIQMTGVWRLWFEHPSKEQFQIDNVPKAKNTNPDHSFEIHPVLKVNSIDLHSSLTKINGYSPYSAITAFQYYNKTKCKITVSNDFIIIDTKKNRYNYTKFKIKILNKESVVDGVFVNANVYSTRNKKVADNIRMVFPKDSEAELELRSLGVDNSMTLLGIPRINLDGVNKLILNSPGETEIKSDLPYEMIIVGKY